MIFIVMYLYQIAIVIVDFFHLLFQMAYLWLVELWYVFSPPKMKSLVGETALVTGAGHGIGKELALQFSRLGAKVVCVDLNEEWNKKTVAQITTEGGASWGFQCDVGSREEVKDVSTKIRRSVGDVTVLVNNAGIMPCKPFLRYSESEVRKIFDVNVFSHYWMLQEWLPSFISSGHGHVVAMSSLCGVMGTPNLVPYCSSKFAITGLMEGLFEELRYGNQNPGIKLTRIHPYTVDTGLAHKPRIRFPSLFPVLSTADVASRIIKCMRRDQQVLFLPEIELHIYNALHLFPRSIQQAFVDFFDTGVDAHEE